MKIKHISKIVLLLIVIGLSACGLYKSPLPPEYFSPHTINQLSITPNESGIRFTWHSPDKDQQKQKLKYMDGYIVRRTGPSNNIENLKEMESKDLVFIEDNHIKITNELRQKAIKEGKISRKVSPPAESMIFNYDDQAVQRGMYYAYHIIPVNQGGVEGLSSELIQVRFSGTSSEVVTLASTKGSFYKDPADIEVDQPIETEL